MPRRGWNKKVRELLLSEDNNDKKASSLYHDLQFLQHFPKYDNGGDEAEEEQTFAEFLEIGNRPPNEEGTGRFCLTPNRTSIGLLDLTTSATTPRSKKQRGKKRAKPSRDDSKWDALRLYLRCFFSDVMNVEMSPVPLELRKKESKKSKTKRTTSYSLVDQRKQIEFPLEMHYDCIDEHPFLVEIWSILFVLMEYVRSTEYCLVALVNVPLGEKIDEYDDGGDDAEQNLASEILHVLGRACGNRVAVIYVPDDSNQTDVDDGDDSIAFFGTVAHEILHCMGFDHTTTYWKCLMNPSVSSSSLSMFLAPHNLKKLQVFLTNEKENTLQADVQFVLKRYRSILGCWMQIFQTKGQQKKAELDANERWLKSLVKYLETL